MVMRNILRRPLFTQSVFLIPPFRAAEFTSFATFRSGRPAGGAVESGVGPDNPPRPFQIGRPAITQTAKVSLRDSANTNYYRLVTIGLGLRRRSRG